MLLALKDNTEASYVVRLMAIRQQELELTVRQANCCGTLFALLAGIMADSMWTGYYMYEIGDYRQSSGGGAHGEGASLELLAALCMYLAIFVPLLGLWHCMLLTLLAPRRALHGPQRAFGSTVDALRHEFLHVLELLAASVGCIFSTVSPPRPEQPNLMMHHAVHCAVHHAGRGRPFLPSPNPNHDH